MKKAAVDLDARWRRRIAQRCGGEYFDAPGSGYDFSAVLAEERKLAQADIAGNPSLALICFSIADPTDKMSCDAWDMADLWYRHSPDATRYTDLCGITPMIVGSRSFGDTHEEIVAYLKKRFPGEATAQLTPDWTQYSGHGIKGILAAYVSTALFDQNTCLFFPTPGYGVIKSEMNRQGCQTVDLPLQPNANGRWLIDINQLCEANFQCRSEKPVVYVNIPHNPTGTGYTANEWEQLLAWAYSADAILIVDEAYFDIYYDEKYVSVLTIPGWEKSCIVLQSISKGWNATGLRFGWMIGHPTAIAALRKVVDVKDSGLLGTTIAAGQECLRHPEWAVETRENYRQLHEMLLAGLQQAGFAATMPNAGLCQFVPAPNSANGMSFANAAECAQWLRSNLRISTMHYEAAGRPYLRWAVTFRPNAECGLLSKADVIAEAVRRLQSVNFTF